MNRLQIQEKLFTILHSEFQLDVSGFDFDRSIFEQMAIDSMLLVSIAARVEKEFTIELPLTFMENPTLNSFFATIEQELFAKA